MNKTVKLTAFIMAILLTAFNFAACSSVPADNSTNEELNTKRYSVTYYADEVPSFVADKVIKSMKMYDITNDVDLGLVTEVLAEDSISYASKDGKLILTSKVGYKSLMITATVAASEDVEGLHIGDTVYGIGHKDALRVGNTEVELTLRSYEVID